jgi:hypothetical protein
MKEPTIMRPTDPGEAGDATDAMIFKEEVKEYVESTPRMRTTWHLYTL